MKSQYSKGGFKSPAKTAQKKSVAQTQEDRRRATASLQGALAGAVSDLGEAVRLLRRLQGRAATIEMDPELSILMTPGQQQDVRDIGAQTVALIESARPIGQHILGPLQISINEIGRTPYQLTPASSHYPAVNSANNTDKPKVKPRAKRK